MDTVWPSVRRSCHPNLYQSVLAPETPRLSSNRPSTWGVSGQAGHGLPAKAPGCPRKNAGTRGTEIYGLAIVSKASVRFAVLPVFACTKSETKVLPIVASPS